MKYGSSRTFVRVLFLCALFAFSQVPHLRAYASGGLSITEIMYDPAGTDDKREWVEVCNASSAGIDMQGDYLLTDGVGSSKHSLVPQQASSVVPAGDCAVIVQDPAGFRDDFPSYAGVMFDSSWTGLTATVGKTIVITDSQLNVLDQATYDPTVGGGNTGDSLQKNSSGVWLAAAPSPGAMNADDAVSVVPPDDGSASDGSSTSDADSSSDSTANSSSAASSISSVSPTASSSASSAVASPILTSAGPHGTLSVPAYAVAGIPVTISDAVYASGGAPLFFGAGHFALGDGDSHDGMAQSSFEHVYEHPGTYAVTFEYRQDPYSPDAVISLHANIQVDAPSVSISSVMQDGSIELLNSSSREADISGWVLAPNGQLSPGAFHVPPGTMVLPGKKVIFAPAVTGLAPVQAATVAILLPSGVLASATSPIPTVVSLQKVVSPAKASTVSASKAKKPKSPSVSTVSSSGEDSADSSLAADADAADSDDAVPAAGSARPLVPIVVGLVAAGAAAFGYYKYRASKNVLALARQPRSVPAYPDKDETDEASSEIRILEE